MLTRTRSILYVDPQSDTDPEFEEFVAFTNEVEPDDVPDRGLSITRELWAELGHPLVLTLTIEPGDTLNP
jgi:hypothetical protein